MLLASCALLAESVRVGMKACSDSLYLTWSYSDSAKRVLWNDPAAPVELPAGV